MERPDEGPTVKYLITQPPEKLTIMRRFIPLLILFIATAVAEEQSVKPGINDKFLDPALKVQEWTEKFETESREIFHQRNEIIASVGLKPGMKVADVGAATGLFTLPFAKAVGVGGKVYAVEIARNFLTHIRARAQKANVANVETILCTERSVELPEGSIDLAFICDTYHHFEYPRASLASLHKALKPGGEFVLIDFKRIPGESSDFVMGHVRAGQEVFEAEITAAGFEKVGEVKDVLKENYFVRFRKP
jgi:ubiquinone/menaquinone biosynthesis C-methylase UbiE